MQTASRIFFLVILVVVSYVAGTWNNRRVTEGNSAGLAVRKVLYYQCPMHPGIQSDKPGPAPCCGMEMVPVFADDVSGAWSATSLPPGTVRISAEKQQVIGLRTALVEKTAEGRTMRLVGRVSADETRIYRIKAALRVGSKRPTTIRSAVCKQKFDKDPKPYLLKAANSEAGAPAFFANGHLSLEARR